MNTSSINYILIYFQTQSCAILPDEHLRSVLLAEADGCDALPQKDKCPTHTSSTRHSRITLSDFTVGVLYRRKNEGSKHENHVVPILYISESYTLMTIQNYGMLSSLASPSNLSTLTLMPER